MSDNDNIFLRPPSGYIRNLDVLGTANLNSAMYLHLMSGKDLDKCMKFVTKNNESLVGGVNVNGLTRTKSFDRIKSVVPIDNFLSKVADRKLTLSPNMVAYDCVDTRESTTANYLDTLMNKRASIKEEGGIAEIEGDVEKQQYCSSSEAGIKRRINGLSGIKLSAYNTQYNKTAHTTLCTTCRVATSYSNALTESMIGGNRNYYTPSVTISSIVSTIRLLSDNDVNNVITEFKLVYPTKEQVFELVVDRSSFYWSDESALIKIKNLIYKLTPVQLAKVYYNCDLKDMAILNKEVILRMFNDFNDVVVIDINTIEEAEHIVSTADVDIITLASIMRNDILKGGTVKSMKANSESDFKFYACTIHHLRNVVSKYSNLFVVFFVNDTLAPSVYDVPITIRRAVVGSDTDSTLFTVQWWVKFYFGRVIFSPKASVIANIVIYLKAQIIAHQLAIVSRQLGVVDKDLYRIRMKNEYNLPVFSRANRSKHYITLTTVREGNVFKVPKEDFKGVGLIGSSITKHVQDAIHQGIINVLYELMENDEIDLVRYMQRSSNMEHRIIKSLLSGSTTYTTNGSIDVITHYDKPMSSPYTYHDLWCSVFEDEFGKSDELPYSVVKLSVNLSNITALNAWVTTMRPDTASRMRQWLKRTGKRSFKMLLLPLSVVGSNVPKLFSSIISTRTIVSNNMYTAYLFLEMCGIYYKNIDDTRLLSDEFPDKEEIGYLGNGAFD